MQLNYEISAAEQTVKDDEKAGGQPAHIQRQIKLARQSSVLSQFKIQKAQNRK